MSLMRNRLLPVLPVLPLLPLLLIAVASRPAAAQTALQLRWELEEDVFQGPWARSRAAFVITNRDTRPLPTGGWAIYFNAMHQPQAGTTTTGFTIENVLGDLHRLMPGPGFAGLAPGDSARIRYLTGLIVNRSFAPNGPYIVFAGDSAAGHALKDYSAVLFQRPWQGDGRGPRVVTPEDQFALDAIIRDIPVTDLPPVFPTPVTVMRRAGELRLTAMPAVQAPDSLRNEAAFAEEVLRPVLGNARRGGGPALRLELGHVEGHTSPEAYELVVDPAQGIRIVGASPAGVFYGLQSLRSLLPPSPRGGLVLPAIRVVDAPRFGYRGLMRDVARTFQPKALVLRTLDLLARYKLNVFHFHITDDEGWRVEMPSFPELTAIGARRGHTVTSDARPAFIRRVLASTIEYVKIPRDVACDLKLKSTLGRLWINHSLAGWCDPGFQGQITLELQNLGPVPFVLQAGRRIAQLIFIAMESEPDVAYGEPGSSSHYQGQTGTTLAR